jgi:hypothetical protein
MCKLYANVFKCLYSCAYVDGREEGHAHEHVCLVNLTGLLTEAFISVTVFMIQGTDTHHLTTITLMTNCSNDKHFLKKISIQTTINIFFLWHIKLSDSPFYTCWRNSVLTILQQKDYLSGFPSTYWRVYIPPHFVFLTNDQSDLWPHV